jgi:hypothetical protein
LVNSPNGSRAPLSATADGHDASERDGAVGRPQHFALTDYVPGVSDALGAAWARDVASALRAQTRSLVGGWPGTMREARSRVLLGVPAARSTQFDPDALVALARAVYDAARRSWDEIAEPDLEP